MMEDKLLEKLWSINRNINRVIPSENGNIPILAVKGKGLAEAWENSLLMLYAYGCSIRTEYDDKNEKGEFIDPLSKDSTLTFVVEDPSSEPLIHRAFPGGLPDLEEYRQEVVEGVKNHWVRDPTNPKDTRWEYTYNERLFEFSVPLSNMNDMLRKMPPEMRDSVNEERKRNGGKSLEFLTEKNWVRTVDVDVKKWRQEGDSYVLESTGEKEPHLVIDQIGYIVEKLSEQPYSRRAQATTWKPQDDLVCFDPPCLQSLWFRIIPDEEGIGRLNLNVRFRSRDAYDAAFMNAFAFIHLQEDVAKRISERSGKPIQLGRYMDISDSYHIYGRRLEHFENNFLSQVYERSFEDRTWTREFAKPFFEEAKPLIKEKILKQDRNRI